MKSGELEAGGRGIGRVFRKLFNQVRARSTFLMINLWNVNYLAIKRKLVLCKINHDLEIQTMEYHQDIEAGQAFPASK